MGLARSGSVYLDYSSARHLGLSGYAWTRSLAGYILPTKAFSYYLDFNNSGINPSNNYVRWSGLPVRCLVYWLDFRRGVLDRRYF